MIYNVEQYIIKTLRDLKRTKMDNLIENRYKRLRAIGSSCTKAEKIKAVKPKLPDRVSVAAQLEKAKTATTTQSSELKT
jgi:hypothetical protein